MKRILSLTLAFATLILTSSTAIANDDVPITPDQLPAAAQEFIKKHFPEQTIAYAEKDVEYAKTTFEVRLNDGSKVEFTANGDWDNVDCKYRAVPAGLVPEAAAKYVSAHFPGALIVKVDKEMYGWEIELNNDLELKFSKDGKLLGIDD